MKKHIVQYTIRNIPVRTDQLLRESAAAYGTSLNEAAISALNRGVGATDHPLEHDDLDPLIGSWVQDPECDKALADMDRVDPELWA